MERVFNFSAGPSTMPIEVLERAQKELVNYGEAGMSVMEMSHRSKDYQEIIDRAEGTLREVMNIPDDYKVLFLQGGGSTQFAMIPMNFMHNSKKACYINTGAWTKKSIKEAKMFGDVKVVGTSEDKNFAYIPKTTRADFDQDADYAYICQNNTIFGTRYTKDSLPDVGNVPLISDLSSNILSEEVNVSDYAMIFAGAQKNVGMAGVTICIIKDSFLENTNDDITTMLKYSTHVAKGSMFNTPPTYAIYIAGLMFEWVKNQGGVKELERRNNEKADLLYGFIDASDMYTGTVATEDRSLMNVTFVTGDADLDAKFIAEAKEQGMVNLKGHRSVGGIRASIYNAMPLEGVQKLVNFMKEFEKNNR